MCLHRGLPLFSSNRSHFWQIKKIAAISSSLLFSIRLARLVTAFAKFLASSSLLGQRLLQTLHHWRGA